MSSDFRAPRQSDQKAWEVVATLTRAGFPYFRLYESLPLHALGHAMKRPKGLKGVVMKRIRDWPETLAEAEAFIARHRGKAMPVAPKQGRKK